MTQSIEPSAVRGLYVYDCTCMSSSMTLQIEGIVESLATEGAQVTLDVAVTLHVTVQKALQCKGLLTNP